MIKHCDVCNFDVVAYEEPIKSGPHYSRLTCPSCGRFFGWGKKPENKGKRSKNLHTPESLGISHCQMCMRDKYRLGTRGVLEVHHVFEIQHHGDDAPENIWVVCTSCHRLIHHQRTYLRDHMQNMYTEDELVRMMEINNVPTATQEVMRRIFCRWQEAQTHE